MLIRVNSWLIWWMIVAVLCLVTAAAAESSDLPSAVSGELDYVANEMRRTDEVRGVNGLRMGIGAVRVSDRSHFVPTLSDTELLVTFQGRLRRQGLRPGKLSVIRPLDLMDFHMVLSFKDWRLDKMKRNEFSVEGSLYGLGVGSAGSSGKKRGGSFALGYAGFILTGMDYYRSEFGTLGVNWDAPLKETTPHLQYFVLKPVGGKGWGQVGWRYSRTSVGLAVFPFFSSNSSILLHDQKGETQTDCTPFGNPTFRSDCGGKQNYYYSFGGMVQVEGSGTFRRLFELGVRYKIYFFRPLLEREPIRDRVNYLRTHLRLFVESNMQLEMGFEQWNLRGRIGKFREGHTWGGVFASVLYRI